MCIRLLFVARPAVGGMANHIRSLCTLIDPARYSITLACPASTADLISDLPVSYIPLPIADRLSPPADLRVLGALYRLMRQGDYDLAHTHGLKAALLATLAYRATKVPLVITLHNRLPEPRRKSLRILTNAVLRWVLKTATHVVVVSQAQADEILRRRLLASQRLSVIPNGISPDAFTAHAVDADRVRQSWGIPPDGLLILMVGRMIAAKGVEDLLTAAQVLVRQGNYYFALAGAGPDLAGFRQVAQETGLTERVRFLGYRDDIATLLQCADIFVLPSYSEGMPLTVLEAMAAGKPIVATRVGGIPELIEHDVTGVLVEPRQPRILAAALHHLAQDPARRERLSRAAKTHVTTHFTDTEMVRRLLLVYQQLLARH
ncbi:MAG TPA: glycosyltransferase family 4 protein [Firmicutes bacterium]|jgi:glycosyltransferase involved in cell wall biosynthesis|nr:glycosyltransferase family 4 protein [Bacillota bacterium]